MAALRVAHFTPTYFGPDSVVGGGERYVANIAQAVRAAAAVDEKLVEQTIVSLGSADRLLSLEHFPVRILKNENNSSNAMDAMSQYLWQEAEGFDIIHVHQSLTVFGAFASVIAASLHKKLVMTDLGGGHHPVMTTGRGLDLADGVISISNFAHSLIVGNYSGPYRIVIGPLDTNKFKTQQNWGPNNKSVLCVSRILPHKGIDRIIQALPDGLSLKVVGRVYNEEYYNHLKLISTDKDVQFIHDADDKALVQLYCQAGLFAQASTSLDIYGNKVGKTELMGLTTLEALSCGIPVLVSNGGSLPEMVPSETFGLVFTDNGDLHQKLLAFERGEWPIKFSSKAASQYVEKNFSPLAVGRKVLAFYEEISANTSI